MKKGPETELLSRYLERANKAGRQLGISSTNVQEWNESKAATSDQRKAQEGETLLSNIKSGSLFICLDERGKDMSSDDLSKIFRHTLDNSVPQIAFTIGGPDGHSPLVQEKADKIIRLGKMTWPHQLARVMLAEQIFRSITILSGHPYHRE